MTRRFSSLIPGSKCGCGRVLDLKGEIRDQDEVDSSDGPFVKGGAVRYMITDDLHLTPFTIAATLSLFHSLRIKDVEKLENRVVNVNKEQILSLLKGTLKSRTPLTDVFLLSKSDSINCDDNTTEDFYPTGTFRVEAKPTGGDSKISKTISVSLLQSKSKGKVVFAESGEELVDQLFSFLTFPLGSIVNILDKRSSLGCVDNLYQSVKLLADPCNGYIKDEDCKNLLLSPKLATQFSCTHQLLGIDEDQSSTATYYKRVCSDVEEEVTIETINPKLPTPGLENGGGFVKKSVKFLVADEMTVAPLSLTTAIDAVKELNMSFDNLIERKGIWGEVEVLQILKACLTSPTVLSKVFSANKKENNY